MVEPHSSNFRVITTNFLGVRIVRKFTVIVFFFFNYYHHLVLTARQDYFTHFELNQDKGTKASRSLWKNNWLSASRMWLSYRYPLGLITHVDTALRDHVIKSQRQWQPSQIILFSVTRDFYRSIHYSRSVKGGKYLRYITKWSEGISKLMLLYIRT